MEIYENILQLLLAITLKPNQTLLRSVGGLSESNWRIWECQFSLGICTSALPAQIKPVFG